VFCKKGKTMTDATYNVMKPDNGVPIKAWTRGVPLEDAALQQLLNVAQLPFIYKWVAAMPDVHWGIGATVGSVIPTRGAIIPAAVGVDIGCGMMAVQTSLHAEVWAKMEPAYKAIVDKYPKLDHKQRVNHLGTLGTGNHFIEVCLDESENVWFLLHSGSRGVGNRFGTFFIELAKNDMRQWMINLPDRDLAYLPQGTEHFEDYVRAVHWAQDYALANRDLMMQNMIAAVKGSGEVPAFEANVQVVSCHHNYVTWEHHYGENVLITRKGAVRAREGDMGIIPGSMGARSYIVRGKGNPESFMSCSHGAGRAMSRSEAKRRFSLDDHAKATAGVECRKDADVIDETPMAYKSIDAVMEAQRDLVDVVHTLRQVVCVKG
jgi:tRNA-splicing ligase RtcB